MSALHLTPSVVLNDLMINDVVFSSGATRGQTSSTRAKWCRLSTSNVDPNVSRRHRRLGVSEFYIPAQQPSIPLRHQRLWHEQQRNQELRRRYQVHNPQMPQPQLINWYVCTRICGSHTERFSLSPFITHIPDAIAFSDVPI